MHQKGKEDLRARQADWFSKKAKEAKGDQADAALKPKGGNANAAAALGREEAQQEQALTQRLGAERVPELLRYVHDSVPCDDQGERVTNNPLMLSMVALITDAAAWIST